MPTFKQQEPTQGFIQRCFYFLCFISIFSVSFSYYAQSTEHAAPTALNQIAAEFISNGWNFVLGNNEQEIKINLGLPSKVQKKKYYNPYFHKNEWIYTFFYHGLTFCFLEPNPKWSDRILSIQLKISSPEWKLRHISLGMTQDKIVSILGSSFVSINSNTIEYQALSSSVRLIFNKGKLKSVVWDFYTG